VGSTGNGEIARRRGKKNKTKDISEKIFFAESNACIPGRRKENNTCKNQLDLRNENNKSYSK
jgi:hypothetical protein